VLDFKDKASLRVLTTTLLEEDFGLKVEIPLDRLIPTLPLRLNYLLWIEDLLEIAKITSNVNGIDIGMFRALDLVMQWSIHGFSWNILFYIKNLTTIRVLTFTTYSCYTI
jgi:hypothetical protein